MARRTTASAPSGKRLGREVAAGRRREEQSYLPRLLERMIGDEARNAREAEYLALVDRMLEDRRVTKEEAELLINMAESWGMTRPDVREAHRAYLASLVSEAVADGEVSEAERRDLAQVCDLLGQNRAAIDVLIAEASTHKATTAPERRTDLHGKSVCFTGELLGQLRGERITRELAESLAAEAGLEIRANVTKTLDLLVVADPDTQSIKAKKARQYGVRIVAEARFWQAIGVSLE